MQPARLVWLFDVDGTLLSTDGAAREAFAHALRERLGVEDDLADIAFAGRTDRLILGDILKKHRVTFSGADTLRFWEASQTRMAALLAPGRGTVLPGVMALLEAIGREPGWVPALLTGNATGMARVKLGHFRLMDRFEFGAFGDEAEDRNALACLAVERATRRYGVPSGRCVVVGDTEHDIACARAAGAHAVAVATGIRPHAELARYEPDLLLEDLTDTEAVLAWARRLTAAR
jgi:phosphoglycolate phosphatase